MTTTFDAAVDAAVRRLIDEDAVGQLRRRDGLMAALGSEDGALKLDWVEAVARLLTHPEQLEHVEAEARDIRNRGIHHIIWAGMGGSVLTVRVLQALGFCGDYDALSASDQAASAVTIYPLDSTDPAALNTIVRSIATAKQLALPLPTGEDEPARAAFLRTLLRDVMMIGVSMGMTSEEPITHLTWFADLLEQAHLRPEEHLLIMTLPGSYLDAFASARCVPSRPLQLDGGAGTGGRMSAPGTRVFLLPAALYLTGLPDSSGHLHAVLRRAWDDYDLDLATAHPQRHPFVRLAATMSAASRRGTCRLLVSMPESWRALVPWLEQLMEESLGKGGKGVIVFDDQALNPFAPGYFSDDVLRVEVTSGVLPGVLPAAGVTTLERERRYTLTQRTLGSAEPVDRLSALAASLLGWQLSMALYGFLHQIHFAGQPAVENYKSRARALRGLVDPLQIASLWPPALRDGALTLLAPAGTVPPEHPADVSSLAFAFVRSLQEVVSARDAGAGSGADAGTVGYLDVTVNGEFTTDLLSLLDERVRAIGNRLLGVPVKLRQAPAAYHSTEQSEMDGPPYVVSLRLVARASEPCLVGAYSNTFLLAQAISTWQAMTEVGRPCFLLILDRALIDAQKPLAAFLTQIEHNLHAGH
jgi:hypothetical protein